MATLTVVGYATRIFFDNKGVEVTEHSRDKDGNPKTEKYTAWFDTPFVYGENAYGIFEGHHGKKVREWTDRDGNPVMNQYTGKQGITAEISINATTFTPQTSREDFEAVTPAAPAAEEDAPF